MRISSLAIRDSPPIALFEASEFADVVVLAGPNGVGKTRLIERLLTHFRGGPAGPDMAGLIEATSKQEREAWGKSSLDLSNAEDLHRLRATLQTNRSRNKLTSSILNIESNRAITKISPFAFSWDITDPLAEEISWDFSLGFIANRWQDTLHSMFRLIEHQRRGIATRAQELQRKGFDSMKLSFSDPMEPFKKAFVQLVGPKELADPAPSRQTLEYQFEGQTLDISTLSSGEREVVNVAFDFLLRNPKHCIVFFDEPELHLHPELAYRLIQTLQTIGDQNQLILSTHSAEIITSSLDKSVIFVSPPKGTQEAPINQAIPVNESDSTNRALRLLGHSVGIVALGKRIVLVEGSSASLDKQTYGPIVRSRFPEFVLVPSGGRHTIESFDSVYESVLSRTLWGVEFFMLTDQDSAPPGATMLGDRLRVLSRYHLENFFLDADVWVRAFSQMESADSWLLSAEHVDEVMRELGKELISYAVALRVASRVRLEVGNIDIMPSDCHGQDPADLYELLRAKIDVERARVNTTFDLSSLHDEVEEYFRQLSESLSNNSREWASLIPGKPLLSKFAARAGIHSSRAKRMYLNIASDMPAGPFTEIFGIFQDFHNVATRQISS